MIQQYQQHRVPVAAKAVLRAHLGSDTLRRFDGQGITAIGAWAPIARGLPTIEPEAVWTSFGVALDRYPGLTDERPVDGCIDPDVW